MVTTSDYFAPSDLKKDNLFAQDKVFDKDAFKIWSQSSVLSVRLLVDKIKQEQESLESIPQRKIDKFLQLLEEYSSKLFGLSGISEEKADVQESLVVLMQEAYNSYLRVIYYLFKTTFEQRKDEMFQSYFYPRMKGFEDYNDFVHYFIDNLGPIFIDFYEKITGVHPKECDRVRIVFNQFKK